MLLIGWNAGSAAFSTMVTSDASRAQFVDNTVKFLKLHKFDGLDLVIRMMSFFSKFYYL